MTARYFVTEVSPCPRCDGAGHRPHPERPGHNWPCGNCLGTGEDRAETPLTDALRALGVRFVDTTETNR